VTVCGNYSFPLCACADTASVIKAMQLDRWVATKMSRNSSRALSKEIEVSVVFLLSVRLHLLKENIRNPYRYLHFDILKIGGI